MLVESFMFKTSEIVNKTWVEVIQKQEFVNFVYVVIHFIQIYTHLHVMPIDSVSSERFFNLVI